MDDHAQKTAALASETRLMSWDMTPVSHARGLEDLIGLYTSFRQGDPSDSIAVRLTLSCDCTRFQVERVEYAISVSCCYVGVGLQNATVVSGSLYEHWSRTGNALEAERTTTRTERKRSIGVIASVAAAVHQLPTASGAGTAGGRLGTSFVQERVSERDKRIELIRTAGQNRWLVGIPGCGDPRRSDGVLAGSYFDEEPSEASADSPPLCLVRVNRPSSPVEMSLVVTVPLSQFHVSRGSGKASYRERELVDDALLTAAAGGARRHAGNVRELRARVAGLVVAKWIQQKQSSSGLSLPSNEIVVAQQTFVLLSTGSTS